MFQAIQDYFKPIAGRVRTRDIVRELPAQFAPRQLAKNLMDTPTWKIGENSNDWKVRTAGGVANSLLNPVINFKDFSREAANRYYGVPEKTKSQLVGMGMTSGLDALGMFGGSIAARRLAANAAKLTNLQKPIAGFLGNSARQGLKAGMGYGAGYGLANSLSNNAGVGDTARNTLVGGALGGATGGALGWGIPSASALGSSLKGRPMNTLRQIGKSLPRPGMTIENVGNTPLQEGGKIKSKSTHKRINYNK